MMRFAVLAFPLLYISAVAQFEVGISHDYV